MTLGPQNSNWTLEAISQMLIHQVTDVHGSSLRTEAALVEIRRESNL